MRYVKYGLPGYGPDLDPDDVALDNVRDVADVIRDELDRAADFLLDSAAGMADAEFWEDAYRARVKVDELETLRANLDWRRRQNAPLYRDDPAALDATLERIIAETFPLDLYDSARLYVWDDDA